VNWKRPDRLIEPETIGGPVTVDVKDDVSEETIRDVKSQQGILAPRPLAEQTEQAKGFLGGP
jgi:hypothetical protein